MTPSLERRGFLAVAGSLATAGCSNLPIEENTESKGPFTPIRDDSAWVSPGSDSKNSFAIQASTGLNDTPAKSNHSTLAHSNELLQSEGQLITTNDSGIQSYSVSNGDKTWSKNRVPATLLLSSGYLFAGSDGVTALDPGTGDIEWTVSPRNDGLIQYAADSLAIQNGYLYCADPQGALYAVEDESVGWSRRKELKNGVETYLVGAGDRIVRGTVLKASFGKFGTNSGSSRFGCHIDGYDLEGTEQFEREIVGLPTGFHTSGGYLYIPSVIEGSANPDDVAKSSWGFVTVLDVQTGELIARHQFPEREPEAFASVPDDDDCLIAFDDTVYRASAKLSTVEWSQEMLPSRVTTLASSTDHVYVGVHADGGSYELYAISLDTGSTSWKRSITSGTPERIIPSKHGVFVKTTGPEGTVLQFH